MSLTTAYEIPDRHRLTVAACFLLFTGGLVLPVATSLADDDKLAAVDKSDDGALVKAVTDSTGSRKDSSPTNLLAGDIQLLWEHYASKEGVPFGDVWKTVGEGESRNLICTGTPKGFLLTKTEYSDFELTFEWKFTEDPDGNSGVLIFTQNEPRLWPTAMQVQLHQPRAGAVFPSSDATSDNSTVATEGLALEVGKWNSCEIRAQDGRLAVKINGTQAGEVTGCKPLRGRIAIQSEGSVTHFRRIFVRELLSANAKPVPAPKSNDGSDTGQSTKAAPEGK